MAKPFGAFVARWVLGKNKQTVGHRRVMCPLYKGKREGSPTSKRKNPVVFCLLSSKSRSNLEEVTVHEHLF